MVPGRLAPFTVTGVPVGSEPLVQPSVSVEEPVPEQCAACPMYTLFAPSKKTKFAVHWAPSVKVWTPGCTAADEAGAHVGAAAARAGKAVKRQSAATRASRARRFMNVLPETIG